MKLSFYALHKNAVPPQKATLGSACFDLIFEPGDRAAVDYYDGNNVKQTRVMNVSERSLTIMPGDRMMLPTSLVADIPEGHSIRFHPRSSVAIKRGLPLVNCEAVIDSDYVEEIFIPVINVSTSKVIILVGDRMAQGELVKELEYTIHSRKTKPKKKTDRNGGIGSTGE